MTSSQDRSLSIALMCIARPTFDVPLAQSVADTVFQRLEGEGWNVVGAGSQLLMDGESAVKAIEASQSEDIDLVLILQASFADSSMAVDIAEALQERRAPLLLWAVPEERDGGRLRLNSLCGINLAGHALRRRSIAYRYQLTAADAPDALNLVEQLARSGRARRALSEARIGLVGEHPDGFDTCIFDAAGLRETFGAEVIPLSLAETIEKAAAVPADARHRFLERVGAVVSNLDEMERGASEGTGGVYVALAEQARQNSLSGIAVRCWPEFFTELSCAACGAMSILSEEGIPCSCEADVNGTLTLVLLQALADESPFITDLVNVDGATDTGVLWHCGLAPMAMADPAHPVRATVHTNRKVPLLFEFSLRPGRITLARLHELPGQGYQLVIGGGEIVSSPPSFSGTSGVVRFDSPALEVFDRVMTQGLEHHFCIVYGEHRDALRVFADLCSIPVFDLTD